MPTRRAAPELCTFNEIVGVGIAVSKSTPMVPDSESTLRPGMPKALCHAQIARTADAGKAHPDTERQGVDVDRAGYSDLHVARVAARHYRWNVQVGRGAEAERGAGLAQVEVDVDRVEHDLDALELVISVTP